MKKLGRIKSWYIDPDDNRITHPQHNILYCDDEKNYCVRHDDVETDDYDAYVETGSFELDGMTFNARFADIYGRENYTNVTL